jgi:peptidoglycan/xylan/chitin deacetylase (PgdA/CDA1 family)
VPQVEHVAEPETQVVPYATSTKPSKRDLAAKFSATTGLTALIGMLPAKPVLWVLNYHRLGNPDECPYDTDLFAGTAEQFDEQVRFLKRHFHVATIDEVIEIVARKKQSRHPMALITFDDGYIDNYTIAFPVLSSHGVQGTFFIPTSYIGTNKLTWWDRIASIVRRSPKRTVRLTQPSREFNIERDGVLRVIEQVLWTYKLEAVGDTEAFISMLMERFESTPDESGQCFMNWDNVCEMACAGMAIGSHTHSHEILAKLPQNQQLEELTTSKAVLESRLGTTIEAFSYPVGLRDTFSPATQAALRQAKYQVAFSFYGGVNLSAKTDPYDIRRVDPASSPAARFRLQAALARFAAYAY